LDAIPAQTWYLLGIGSIAASLIFQLSGKKNAADFVGKWPPTFFAIGLYHKMIRPGQEDAMGKIQNAAEMAQDKARQVGM
ncbi:MAG: hypothetical protein MUD01_26335, partial [Chloroflexaceae bacterium]|nr:hypothetical protein [Chloroflexaceae bacterium]